MYTYRTEILPVSTKFFSYKADQKDISILDDLLNQRASEGWALVTYVYMATSMQIKGGHLSLLSEKKETNRCLKGCL